MPYLTNPAYLLANIFNLSEIYACFEFLFQKRQMYKISRYEFFKDWIIPSNYFLPIKM